MEQQQASVHPAIVGPIRRLQQQGDDEDEGNEGRRRLEPHQLVINTSAGGDVDRQSVQYLVDFLQGEDAHDITELELDNFKLLQPSDGGLDVLIDFFTSQTTLIKVDLHWCNLGSTEEASRLFAAFETNSSSVINLTIYGIENLEGVAFGNCISGVLQNATHLQKLGLGDVLDAQVIRAFQPSLRTNRHLKIFNLSCCSLGDDGIRLISDALVGNTTIEILDITTNDISSNGLDDITRLLESTQIKDIDFAYNNGVFSDNAATQRFADVLSRNKIVQRLALSFIDSAGAMAIFRALESNTVLEEMGVGFYFAYLKQCVSQLIESLPRMKGLKRLRLYDAHYLELCMERATFIPALHENTSLEELVGLDSAPWRHFPEYQAVAANGILARNRDMRRADLLLALQPGTGMPIASKSGIWCMAFAKFAMHGLSQDGVQKDDDTDEDVNDSDSDANTSSGDEHGSHEDDVQMDAEEEGDDEMNNSVASATSSVEEQGPGKDELKSDNNNDDEEVDDGDNDGDNDNNNRGPAALAYPSASAIFKILQRRPTIVGKQVQRPAASKASRRQPPTDDTNTDGHDNTRNSIEGEPSRKRRRL